MRKDQFKPGAYEQHKTNVLAKRREASLSRLRDKLAQMKIDDILESLSGPARKLVHMINRGYAIRIDKTTGACTYFAPVYPGLGLALAQGEKSAIQWFDDRPTVQGSTDAVTELLTIGWLMEFEPELIHQRVGLKECGITDASEADYYRSVS